MPTPVVPVKKPVVKSVVATDWTGLWAASLGLSAVATASVAYFGGDDAVGASFVLIAAAAIVALHLVTAATAAGTSWLDPR